MKLLNVSASWDCQAQALSDAPYSIITVHGVNVHIKFELESDDSIVVSNVCLGHGIAGVGRL